MEVTGPFAVTLGTELDVTPPSGASKFNRVILANASPLACQVNSGGVAQWLQPWTADVYPTEAGNPAQITPQFTTGNQTAGQITASWLLPGDPLDGTYPLSLQAQAFAASIVQEQILSGTQIAFNAGGPQTIQVPVPAGIQSLIVQITPGLGNLPNVPVTVSTGSPGGYTSDVALISGGIIPVPFNDAIIDVLGGYTVALTINPTTALGITGIGVTGSGYPAAQLRADRADPAFWGSYKGYTVSPAAGTTGTVLVAPDAGMAWDIETLQAFSVAGAANTANYIELKGLATSTPLGLAGQIAGACTIGPLRPGLLPEGVALVNNMAAAAATASCYARQIPATV